MIILGVESSCDETALALVEDGVTVLSSKIASQVARHAVFGGVVPEVAAREHLKALPYLWKELWAGSNLNPSHIDAVAVTRGPGLIGAVLIGVAFARGAALRLSKPLIPVDHVHAHLQGALLSLPLSLIQTDLFPSLALVVSGGHTHLYIMKSRTSTELIGQSIDDACGECFDKVGKILGLPFPGGPWIEKIAKLGDKSRFPMPKVLDDKSKVQFSYSGIKTHALNQWRKLQLQGLADDQAKSDIASSFQEEALGQIIRKLQQARKLYPGIRSVVVAGGVSANARFKELVKIDVDLPVFFPELKYCGDNAAMIASLGYFEFIESDPSKFTPKANWDAYSRYGTGGPL